jgi:hypothetical protein
MRIAVFVAAGLVVFTGLLRAQSDDDDEDEMDYYPLVPTGNSMRFGMRFIGGPKVAFHDVGSVPATRSVADLGVTADRTYNDGYVDVDTRGTNDGQTNKWMANYSSQVTTPTLPTVDAPNQTVDSSIAFHVYSADSLGTTIKGRTSSASGWELQVGRSLGKIARKVDVSWTGGFSLSGINAKRSDDVQAELATLTDVYSLSGQMPPSVPYTAGGSTYRDIYDSHGNPVLNPNGNGQQSTVPTPILLAQDPNLVDPAHRITYTTVQVNGHWQIKGGYYMFRTGPTFQLPVTERIKLSFGFGGAVAFIGSTFKVDETIDITDVLAPITNVQEKTRSLLLPAYYMDADAEYWITERAGLYLGATYQGGKSFNQTLGAETATVDLGSTNGVHTGLSLRF